MEKKVLVGTEEEVVLQAVMEGEHRSKQSLEEELRAFLVFALLRLMPSSRGFVDNLTFYLTSAWGRVPQPLLWRNVGDSALVLAGFFPRHANRCNVDPAYYIAMGQQAYLHMSMYDADWNWKLASKSFSKLVDVLLGIPPEAPLDDWSAVALAKYSAMARRRFEGHLILTSKALQ